MLNSVSRASVEKFRVIKLVNVNESLQNRSIKVFANPKLSTDSCLTHHQRITANQDSITTELNDGDNDCVG